MTICCSEKNPPAGDFSEENAYDAFEKGPVFVEIKCTNVFCLFYSQNLMSENKKKKSNIANKNCTYLFLM